ncbi:MAG: choice-of-anchor I family protein, partial [Bacteroidota bacterium]
PAYGDDLDMDGDDDFLSDPEGSISIVEITPGDPPSFEVTTLGFTDFNAGGPRAAELPDGVRIFGDYDGDGIPSTVAQDLEPEYVTVTANGQAAYVTLQENNAIAVVDLINKRIDSILALGTKDHSLAGNGLDASNRDDAINIQTWPVLGFYQPDAVETFRAGGQTYLITANEGDARDYDTYSEEERIGDFVLDPTAFPDAATLQLDENLGRLRTTSANGDIDGDGDYDVLYSYGARSFTIWTTDGTLVFDSGDALEQITAAEIPAYFNSNNGLAEDFDERSDDKGPEPEGVVVGQINGRLYAFVGLERTSAIAVYDITDPTAPEYVSLLQNESDTPGELADVAPEGLAFISRLASPTGNPLLVVTNEVSGTVTTWEIDAPFALTVLHNNDGESQLLGVNTDDDADLEYGGIAHFATVVDQARLEARQTTSGSVLLTSGDNFLPGPEFNASLDDGVYYDALALDRIGYDAFDLGNHDFDFGPDVLAEFISAFPRSNAPFLSANLDFSGEANLQALVDAGRIAPSTVLRVDGERIGVIGLSPPNLRSISSPGGVVIDPNTVAVTQAQIDALEAQGINKIILISHLQSIEEELALIPQLSGIDIVIAGGGDELLVNEDDLLVPGDDFDDRFGAYPLLAQNSDGADVPVVTTTGNYRYLGRLVVEFDADGTLTEVSDASGPIRVAQPASGEMDAVAANPAIQAEVVDPVAASVASLQANVIATTDVPLNGVRGDIRTRETNLGNLIADAFLWQANLLNGEFGVPAADVAFANGGGIRNDGVILPGNITEFDTFDILPFSNFITIVEDIEPAQLKEILENAVSRVEFVSGRFAQVAGLTFAYDPNGTARETDDDGNVTTPGTRVQSVTLADGTAIVRNGMVVDGAPTINVATVDFLARGGDDYPYGDDTFTLLGVSYQQALANYLETELGGTVSEADYPEIGEGRVVDLSAPFTLTILHNNDGESQLLGIDTDDDPDFEFGGIAHFATKVDELRAEAATMTNGSVLLTSGDNFLPGPEFNASLDDEVYYDAIGLDLIGYDGFAIGNHDFDFGPDVLAEFIGAFTETQPPFVSANLDFTAEELAEIDTYADEEAINLWAQSAELDG